MQEKSCLKLPQISNQLWCLKNEQHLNMDSNFDPQMSLSKSKCLYSNNCLCFLKHVVPSYNKPLVETGCQPTVTSFTVIKLSLINLSNALGSPVNLFCCISRFLFAQANKGDKRGSKMLFLMRQTFLYFVKTPF